MKRTCSGKSSKPFLLRKVSTTRFESEPHFWTIFNFSLFLATLTADALPEAYRIRALRHVATGLEESRHLDFYLRWCTALLNKIGATRVVTRAPLDKDLTPTLIAIQKCLTHKFEQIGKM